MAVETSPDRTPLRRRVLVAVVLTAAAVLHVPPAVQVLDEAVWAGVLSLLFAAAALSVVVLLVHDGRPSLLVAVALVGMLGVAMYFLTRLVPLPGLADEVGSWTQPWALAAFFVDALVVRLAVFTLRVSSPSPA